MGSPEKAPTKTALAQIERLRKLAFGYPETHEDHPWGHVALKVKGKVFVFLGADGNDVGFSLKLPFSRDFALTFPGTQPTPYGLGKSGWVSGKAIGTRGVPEPIVVDWIDESWRAVAPKTLVKMRSGGLDEAAEVVERSRKAGSPASRVASRPASPREKRSAGARK